VKEETIVRAGLQSQREIEREREREREKEKKDQRIVISFHIAKSRFL
jgi:hypothetical protein